ncbi:MAG: hypothetical protein EA426_17510 [Spirochaetaceae bacterium]|nr:MAG: hypothetical protein EA426_17510 [Spirochaetaceae bacterium]
MIPMAVTAAVTSFFSFVLGYLVYRQNPGKKENTLFLLMSLFLGTWGAVAVFAYSAPDLPRFIVLYRAGFIFQMLYLGTFLFFAMIITGYTPRRSRRAYLVYVPCVAAIVFFFAGTGTHDDYFQIGQMWCFSRRYFSTALLCPAAVWITYYAAAGLLYFRRAVRSTIVAERRLFTILGGLVVAILVATLLEGIVFPAAFDTPSVGPDLLFKFAWLLCVGLLVDRHHFMTSPEKLEDIALTEFPEYAIFVLDEGCTIRKTNREASILLSIDPEKLQGTHIGAIIPSGERLFGEIEKLRANGTASLAGIVDIKHNGTSRMLMDLKISPLHDRSRSITGFIIIGRPVQEKRHLEMIFNLTGREIEIIEEILRGQTNGKMAKSLGISERTVKSHLTHIFGKLGVQNRIQLYALLKKNHFISEHVAEKNLLILQNVRN